MTSLIEEAASAAYEAAKPMAVEQEASLMLFSIAISLKRIADQLDGTAPGFNVHNMFEQVARNSSVR